MDKNETINPATIEQDGEKEIPKTPEEEKWESFLKDSLKTDKKNRAVDVERESVYSKVKNKEKQKPEIDYQGSIVDAKEKITNEKQEAGKILLATDQEIKSSISWETKINQKSLEHLNKKITVFGKMMKNLGEWVGTIETDQAVKPEIKNSIKELYQEVRETFSELREKNETFKQVIEEQKENEKSLISKLMEQSSKTAKAIFGENGFFNKISNNFSKEKEMQSHLDGVTNLMRPEIQEINQIAEEESKDYTRIGEDFRKEQIVTSFGKIQVESVGEIKFGQETTAEDLFKISDVLTGKNEINPDLSPDIISKKSEIIEAIHKIFLGEKKPKKAEIDNAKTDNTTAQEPEKNITDDPEIKIKSEEAYIPPEKNKSEAEDNKQELPEKVKEKPEVLEPKIASEPKIDKAKKPEDDNLSDENELKKRLEEFIETTNKEPVVGNREKEEKTGNEKQEPKKENIDIDTEIGKWNELKTGEEELTTGLKNVFLKVSSQINDALYDRREPGQIHFSRFIDDFVSPIKAQLNDLEKFGEEFIRKQGRMLNNLQEGGSSEMPEKMRRLANEGAEVIHDLEIKRKIIEEKLEDGYKSINRLQRATENLPGVRLGRDNVIWQVRIGFKEMMDILDLEEKKIRNVEKNIIGFVK